MANLNSLYSNFNDSIKLTTAKSNLLKRGRDAIREVIRKDFSDNNRNKPKFRMQGSFAMKTTVNPIGEGEYDLDDGVYLQGFSDEEIAEWPSAAETHQWIENAVDGHTKAAPENKTSCVRVQYEAGYHIDLPVYIVKDEVCYLANKDEGWVKSDPKEFKEWFLNFVINCPYSYGEQLRRTVRYLKAWRDYCEVNLASITLTILAVNHFSSYSGRDDRAVCNTISNLYFALSSDFTCTKPVTPGEELLGDYSQDEQRQILDALKNFKEALESALDEQDEKKASETLRSVYGFRFPLGQMTSTTSAYVKTSAPGVIGNDGRSA